MRVGVWLAWSSCLATELPLRPATSCLRVEVPSLGLLGFVSGLWPTALPAGFFAGCKTLPLAAPLLASGGSCGCPDAAALGAGSAFFGAASFGGVTWGDRLSWAAADVAAAASLAGSFCFCVGATGALDVCGILTNADGLLDATSLSPAASYIPLVCFFLTTQTETPSSRCVGLSIP